MTPLFAIGMPGMPELLIIFVLVFVLFGAKRIPEIARGLGRSMNEFRKAKDEFQDELHPSAEHKEVPVVTPTEPPKAA